MRLEAAGVIPESCNDATLFTVMCLLPLETESSLPQGNSGGLGRARQALNVYEEAKLISTAWSPYHTDRDDSTSRKINPNRCIDPGQMPTQTDTDLTDTDMERNRLYSNSKLMP